MFSELNILDVWKKEEEKKKTADSEESKVPLAML